MIIRWLMLFCMSTSLVFALTEEEEEEAAGREREEEHAAYLIYSPYVRQLEESFAEEMETQLGLHCSGIGHSMHGKVMGLDYMFNAYRRATIEEARALELLAIDKLLAKINDCEPLRPYLEEYPFTVDRIQISIGFVGPNGPNALTASDGDVEHSFIGHLEGTQLIYHGSDAFTDSTKVLLEEPYEEAVKLNAHIPIKNPAVHLTTAQEAALDAISASFIKKMKDQGVEFWKVGTKMPGGCIEEMGANSVIQQRATQDQARKKLLFVVDTLLNDINSHSSLKPFLKTYPFTQEQLKLRIAFKDRHYVSYYDGSSIDSVTLEGNQITYFQRNPEVPHTSEPPVLYKETYQEALKR